MEQSYRFFENKDCRYYPCHKDIAELNCLFCYCPLYAMEHCPGNHQYVDRQGCKIKICTECTFPHKPENYDKIIKILSGNIKDAQ